VWAAARAKYTPNANGLPEDQWTALRVVIDAWRSARPNIVQFWRDLEDAALAAVRCPGKTFEVGGGDRPSLMFKKAGSFLWLRLPSGRALCYPYPRIEQRKMPWTDDNGDPVYKAQMVYKGVDAYTRKWGDCWVYGGLLAENVTQAVARDLLAEAMVRVEAAGYPVVLHVHDEIVAETPFDLGSLSEFVMLMTTIPTWAEGCPVAADGWEGTRYKKA
jgi:DNA polymerase